MSTAPNTQTQKPPTSTVDEQEQQLADGILDHVPSSIADGVVYRQWQPIPWQGKPVSETILDERR